MPGKVRKYRRIVAPMLIELRRNLDEVARDAPCQGRILDRSAHAVERVAELMEHGPHIVVADQSWLTRSGLGKVCDVVDHGKRSHQLRRRHEATCPSAPVLVVTLV